MGPLTGRIALHRNVFDVAAFIDPLAQEAEIASVFPRIVRNMSMVTAAVTVMATSQQSRCAHDHDPTNDHGNKTATQSQPAQSVPVNVCGNAIHDWYQEKSTNHRTVLV